MTGMKGKSVHIPRKLMFKKIKNSQKIMPEAFSGLLRASLPSRRARIHEK